MSGRCCFFPHTPFIKTTKGQDRNYIYNEFNVTVPGTFNVVTYVALAFFCSETVFYCGERARRREWIGSMKGLIFINELVLEMNFAINCFDYN